MGLVSFRLPNWMWKTILAGRHGFRDLRSGGTEKRSEALCETRGPAKAPHAIGNPRRDYSTVGPQEQQWREVSSSAVNRDPDQPGSPRLEVQESHRVAADDFVLHRGREIRALA